jgi:ABC-2 type transport system ATP-binding protein
MKLRAIPGVLSVFPGQAGGSFLLECELGRDIRDEIARVAVLNQWGLLELRTVSMTLEDVFLQLTRHEDHLSEPAEATVSMAPAERTDA